MRVNEFILQGVNKKVQNPIPVTRPYMPKKEDFMCFADSLWQTRWLTHNGPLVEELQNRLKERLQVNSCMVFANGHLALDCAVKALGLHDGEAITTPFTYLSTSHALAMNKLKPIFCDIKSSDCTIDEEKIEALITERTKVIVPVHVYGFPCNYEQIQKIADKHGLKVIYDAAHAFGVMVNGVGIGTLGDASMFSFQATKVFHTVEGGAITYNNADLTKRLVAAKNFGMVSTEEANSISFNAKMSELNAAMGLSNLEIVDWQIEKRKRLIEHYLTKLSNIDGIQVFSWNKSNVVYNYAYFPILFDEKIVGIDRDEIAERLQNDYNVLVRKYFYPLLSDLNCYKEHCSSHDTPNAQKIAKQVLTLPLFVELTYEQVDYICDAVLEILQSAG